MTHDIFHQLPRAHYPLCPSNLVDLNQHRCAPAGITPDRRRGRCRAAAIHAAHHIALYLRHGIRGIVGGAVVRRDRTQESARARRVPLRGRNHHGDAGRIARNGYPWSLPSGDGCLWPEDRDTRYDPRSVRRRCNGARHVLHVHALYSRADAGSCPGAGPDLACRVAQRLRHLSCDRAPAWHLAFNATPGNLAGRQTHSVPADTVGSEWRPDPVKAP